MKNFLMIVLLLHIISGFLALLMGCIAMVAAKGKKLHRLSGKIFFYSMLGVTFSALIISLAKNNQFLLMIAIFSFYMNFAGFRAIQNKSLRPAWFDWLVLATGAVNTFFMIYSMNIVLMVFGGISCFLCIGNVRDNVLVLQNHVIHPLSWLKRHIGMMTGAYIATITAFVVVNSRLFEGVPIPSWLPWLLPSILLGPLIGYWTIKYAGKKIKI